MRIQNFHSAWSMHIYICFPCGCLLLDWQDKNLKPEETPIYAPFYVAQNGDWRVYSTPPAN